MSKREVTVTLRKIFVIPKRIFDIHRFASRAYAEMELATSREGITEEIISSYPPLAVKGNRSKSELVRKSRTWLMLVRCDRRWLKVVGYQ